MSYWMFISCVSSGLLSVASIGAHSYAGDMVATVEYTLDGGPAQEVTIPLGKLHLVSFGDSSRARLPGSKAQSGNLTMATSKALLEHQEAYF